MKTIPLVVALVGALAMSSCAPAPSVPTPDAQLIQTSAAQTVVANFTLTAAAFTPTAEVTTTETPSAAESPTAGAATDTPTLLPGGVTATAILCDAAIFDAATVDVNVPDNTQMQLGQEFVKTWRIRNNGSCSWGAGYKVVYAGYSDMMSGVPQAFTGVVGPGQEVEVSVNFKAPTKPGTYLSAWQLSNPAGKPFPKIFYVKIVVQ